MSNEGLVVLTVPRYLNLIRRSTQLPEETSFKIYRSFNLKVHGAYFWLFSREIYKIIYYIINTKPTTCTLTIKNVFSVFPRMNIDMKVDHASH